MRTAFRTMFAVLLLGGLPAAAAAGTINFHVDVNTAPLIVAPGGPFFLDFQLTGGSGLATNTATIYGITFGGGSVTPPAFTTGGASGDLSTSVSLTDAGSFFNEFFEGFTPGGTLGFNVLETTNTDAPQPDLFAFAILDGSLFNLPTTGLGDSLVWVTLGDGIGVNAVQTAVTRAPEGISARVTAVPEPSAILLVASGLAAALIRRRS